MNTIQKCHYLLKKLIKNGLKESGKLWSDKSKVKILFEKHGCSILCTKKVGGHPACFLVACNRLLILTQSLFASPCHLLCAPTENTLTWKLPQLWKPPNLPACICRLRQLLDTHQLPTNYLHSLLTQVKLLITTWISHMNHIPV